MTNCGNPSCGQCGQDFGPGDHGFSHCEDHTRPTSIADQVDEIIKNLRDDAIFLRNSAFARDIELAIVLIEHYRQVEAMHLKFVEDIKELGPG